MKKSINYASTLFQMQSKNTAKTICRILTVVLSLWIMYDFYFPPNTFPSFQTVCNILFFYYQKEKKIKEEKHPKNLAFVLRERLYPCNFLSHRHVFVIPGWPGQFMLMR